MRAKRKIGITTGVILALFFFGGLSWATGNAITEKTGASIYITFFTLPVLIIACLGLGKVIGWAFEESED